MRYSHGWSRWLTSLIAVAAVAGPARAAAQDDPLAEAQALVAAQDLNGAIEVLEELVDGEPDNGAAWALLGTALRGAARPGEAIDAFERAVVLPEAAPATRFALGVLHLQHRDADRGFSLLDALRAEGTTNLTALDLVNGLEQHLDDPRYRALFPSESEFAAPFEEDTRVLHEWRGEGVGDQFGWIARDIGDVDGDGVHDVVTSAPTLQQDGAAAGRVYVYSGKSGETLWTRTGEPGGQLGIGLEAAGDVNGDGIPDVLAGAPGANTAFVYSGSDGATLLRLSPESPGGGFGGAVSDVGDADGDGHADVLIGSASDSTSGPGRGSATLFSGRTGEPLLRLVGESDGDGFGSAVGGATHDGQTVIVIGAPNAGEGDPGRVYVYEGLDPEPAFVIDSDDSGAQLGGMFVSAVGDVDGDGVIDIYASDWAANAGNTAAGRVYVHSGSTGGRLHELTGESRGDGFGIGSADIGDIDNDGHDDLLIGAWQHRGRAISGGKVYLISGGSGVTLGTITGTVPGETLGFDATGIGDVNGDGVTDFLITSAWSAVEGSRSGRAYVIDGASVYPGAG